MKWFGRGLRLVLCLTMICLFAVAINCTRAQNCAGGYSAATAISEKDKEWVCDRFGGCESIECLLLCIEDYAVQNFNYDKSKIPLFQHFDFRDLIDSNQGICFDFAVWCKVCCLVWADYNDISLKAYVVDVEYDFFKPRHSYNVIQLPDGRSFYIDITNSINEVNVKNHPAPGYELFYEGIKDYAARYGEKVLFLR